MLSQNISKEDMLFVSCLRRAARKNLTAISKELGIPVSTLFDKLKKLEKALIVKHTTIIDFAQLGYNTRATMLLRVARKDKEELGTYLSKNECVNSILKITNGYDFLIETVFMSIQHMEEFCDIIENRFDLLQKQVYFIIDDLQREQFLSNLDLLKSEKT